MIAKHLKKNLKCWLKVVIGDDDIFIEEVEFYYKLKDHKDYYTHKNKK